MEIVFIADFFCRHRIETWNQKIILMCSVYAPSLRLRSMPHPTASEMVATHIDENPSRWRAMKRKCETLNTMATNIMDMDCWQNCKAKTVKPWRRVLIEMLSRTKANCWRIWILRFFYNNRDVFPFWLHMEWMYRVHFASLYSIPAQSINPKWCFLNTIDILVLLPPFSLQSSSCHIITLHAHIQRFKV